MSAPTTACPSWCRYIATGHPAGLAGRRGHVSNYIGNVTTEFDGILDAWIEQRPGQAQPMVQIRCAGGTAGLSLAAAKFFATLLDQLVGDRWADRVQPSASA